MKTYDTIYSIKFCSLASPYFQLVNGNFRHLDAAYKKIDELRQDKSVSKIVLSSRRKKGDRILEFKKEYTWEPGFEVIYLRG